MTIVGIDSSTDILALGIYDGEKIAGEINIRLGQGHNQRVLPYLDLLLNETNYKLQDINGFSVVIGPGSFTGLRISLSTVKAFNLINNFKTVGISSLELLVSAHINQPGYWLPVFDARSSRVYTALFAGNSDLPDENSRVLSDRAVSLQELPDLITDNINKEEKLTILGPGVKEYKQQLKDIFSRTTLEVKIIDGSAILPAGGKLAWLGSEFLAKGREINSRELSPRYLKKSQAEIDYSRKEEE